MRLTIPPAVGYAIDAPETVGFTGDKRAAPAGRSDCHAPAAEPIALLGRQPRPARRRAAPNAPNCVLNYAPIAAQLQRFHCSLNCAPIAPRWQVVVALDATLLSSQEKIVATPSLRIAALAGTAARSHVP